MALAIAGIFVRPVEPGAGQQLDRAAVEPRVHAVPAVFDFVDPVVAFGCRVDELSELRPYPWRQGGRLDASPARYTARHGG
jgi:hypothetical protein